MEILQNDIVIGNEYICKSKYISVPDKLLRIIKIDHSSDIIFVYTNDPTCTYQIYPHKTVSFYKPDICQNKKLDIKILKPNTFCPISLEIINDNHEIIIINGTEQDVFLKDNLEKWFTTKKSNPLTGLLVNDTQLKYYSAVIFNCDTDLFFY